MQNLQRQVKYKLFLHVCSGFSKGIFFNITGIYFMMIPFPEIKKDLDQC